MPILMTAGGVRMCRYKQPEAPDWKGLVPVLRRASRHYNDQVYEEALCTILRQNGVAKYYARSILNLQLPPHHKLECSPQAYA